MTEEEMEVWLEKLAREEIISNNLSINGNNVIIYPVKKGGQDDSSRLHSGDPESDRSNQ